MPGIRLIKSSLCVVTILGVVGGQRVLAKPADELRNELQRTVTEAFRWYAYWRSPRRFEGRPAGSPLRAKLVRFDGENVVFLSQVGLELNLSPADGQAVGQLLMVGSLSYGPAESNESALAGYVKLRSPPCSEDSPRNRVIEGGGTIPPGRLGRTVPLERMVRCGQPLHVLEITDVTLEMPKLELPPYVSAKEWKVPSEILEGVKQAVIQMFRYQPAIAITIPRFSPTDPEVFVFVKADDFQGVQPVERQASGQWHASKFLYDVPKYNLGPLIEKIRKLELVEFDAP